MIGIVLLIALGQTATASPSVGVIADGLVDYSQWAKPHADVWAGAEVARLLEANGAKPTLLTKDDLTLEAFQRFDAILIASDNMYPERGPWGGPVAQALKAYVEQGGIYCMALGMPHWASFNVDTGALDQGHADDFFGLHGSMTGGRGSFRLTKQGVAIGLPEPGHVNAKTARALSFASSTVLVWDRSYTPVLSAAPYGKGWLVHWGAGPEGGMDASVRDFLIPAYASILRAAKAGQLHAVSSQELMASEGLAGKSLDDVDREAFKPGIAPLEGPATQVTLMPVNVGAPYLEHDRSLDGRWQMLGFPSGQGDARALANGRGWEEAVDAEIPCSVQTALFKAGVIPDPVVGFNDQIARREVAEKEWWFRTEFEWTPGERARLVFDGVDYSATFWLNGQRLGEHEGPSGGPEFDISGIARARNTLVVRVDPLPPDWKLVFKFNCVYGWHYVNCPPIGIWQSVHVKRVPDVEVAELFVAAKDVVKATVDAHLVLRGPQDGFEGVLHGVLRPANFEGEAYHFISPLKSEVAEPSLHIRFDVPDPMLWWPVDLGEPNLYELHVAFEQNGAPVDARAARFGIRTIEMKPLPDGARPDRYNWTFVINGRPSFLKGCNWATTDAFLRLDESRYRRFLTMAKDEHIQIMRSWGGGLLETDLFYDICDELGIMVWQEFPLTWQNFDVIPLSVADEIAVRNIERIRNHPSLALWCGGNEHSGEGVLIELLGRRCLELDGTRPYHRTDPYGGSAHNYDVYWGKGPYEKDIALTPLEGGAPVIGETGLASACAVESTLKFLPDDEKNTWPPKDNSAFIHHTPTFTPVNMEHLNRHAKELDPCDDLAGFSRATQLAQATGLRLVLERMRAKWPNATAMVFYKLTDVYPGCSWSTVDYYGVPKIAHYVVQDCYAPLRVCVLYDSLDVEAGKTFAPIIRIVDDLEQLHGPVSVKLRLYDATLKPVAEQTLTPSVDTGRVHDLGTAALNVPQAAQAPLLLVADLSADGLADRAVHWFNFRASPGCLFNLPKTTIEIGRA
ncbi:MAG: glycoside hydrolase family 2 TIM barrel-domain containing protein, partial [Candidatus Hydrogenedentales bacterium]